MNLAASTPGTVADKHDTRTRLTGLETTLVALLAASALINYVDRQATAVVSPLLIREFRMTDEQWGWVTSVFALSYIFTAALGGIWVDRVGVRRGLLISTVIWSIAAAGHALATDFWSLCFWRVMLSLGEGPGGASLLKGIRRVTPPRLRDMGTAIIGAGTLLGALLAPILIAPMAGTIGWRAAFVVTASLGGLWLPFWIAAARAKGANLDAAPEGSAPAAAPAPFNYRSVGLWATFVCIFFSIPPTVFTLSFFPRFLQVAYGLDVKASAAYQWQPFLAMDLGQIAAGALLLALLRRGWDYLPARRLVIAGGFLGATTMVFMALSPNLTWTMVWLNFSRFWFQFAYVGLLAYGISVVQEHEAGRMNGLMNAAFGACNAVFAPIIGKLADHFHHDYRPVIWLVGLLPVLGLAGWVLLSTVHARREREQ